MTTATPLIDAMLAQFAWFPVREDAMRCDSITVTLQTALKAATEGHAVPGHHRVLFGVMVGQFCQMARQATEILVDDDTKARALVLIDAVQKSCVLTLMCSAHAHDVTVPS